MFLFLSCALSKFLQVSSMVQSRGKAHNQLFLYIRQIICVQGLHHPSNTPFPIVRGGGCCNTLGLPSIFATHSINT
ncbi:hypothetical protein DFH07DRAFT_129086 [Mycena maculata]|uniref:Secreted protein n=1 Tax=Mycena maculata TaxID=230809 RepID=A0AAD7I599_9AGAR|nr:hypothetical protein DFH07DRAFT_129086 [Mycena maculata]